MTSVGVWLEAWVDAAWGVTMALAPWLFLGTVIAALLHRFVPKRWVRRSFRGRFGVLKAVLLGVPMPLCSCGVIPAALGLKKQGASDRAAVGFLISTPQTGVDSILVSASFLGWPFAIFKVLSAGVLGLIGGHAVRDTPASAVLEKNEAHEDRPTFRSAVAHGIEVLRSIWAWLLFGIAASATLQVWIPADAFSGLDAGGGILAALLMLVVSVPLYVCTTASVPIAAALVAGGFPLGAALVFLIAGPATNVATIGAVYRTFGLRTLLTYLGTVVLGSLAFGLAFDFVLSSSIQAPTTAHEHQGLVSQLTGAGLLFAMGYFAWESLRRRFRRSVSGPRVVEIPVQGMTCGGCVTKLERCLANTEGVEKVEVELEPGVARIQSRLPAAELQAAIREAGFAPK
ncbi:MAG: permease [Myxococcota bacterium]